jgi:hypothetical protein
VQQRLGQWLLERGDSAGAAAAFQKALACRPDQPECLTGLAGVELQREHWMELDLRNRAGAPALQARVTLQSGPRTLLREVHVCSSYASADDPRLHFGLGDAAGEARAAVRWADGTRESFGPLAVDRIHVLRQGSGGPAR